MPRSSPRPISMGESIGVYSSSEPSSTWTRRRRPVTDASLLDPTLLGGLAFQLLDALGARGGVDSSTLTWNGEVS